MAIQRRGWRDRLSGGLLAGIPAYGSAWAAQQQLGQAGERLELEKERHKESVLGTAATSVTERRLTDQQTRALAERLSIGLNTSADQVYARISPHILRTPERVAGAVTQENFPFLTPPLLRQVLENWNIPREELTEMVQDPGSLGIEARPPTPLSVAGAFPPLAGEGAPPPSQEMLRRMQISPEPRVGPPEYEEQFGGPLVEEVLKMQESAREGLSASRAYERAETALDQLGTLTTDIEFREETAARERDMAFKLQTMEANVKAGVSMRMWRKQNNIKAKEFKDQARFMTGELAKRGTAEHNNQVVRMELGQELAVEQAHLSREPTPYPFMVVDPDTGEVHVEWEVIHTEYDPETNTARLKLSPMDEYFPESEPGMYSREAGRFILNNRMPFSASFAMNAQPDQTLRFIVDNAEAFGLDINNPADHLEIAEHLEEDGLVPPGTGLESVQAASQRATRTQEPGAPPPTPPPTDEELIGSVQNFIEGTGELPPWVLTDDPYTPTGELIDRGGRKMYAVPRPYAEEGGWEQSLGNDVFRDIPGRGFGGIVEVPIAEMGDIDTQYAVNALAELDESLVTTKAELAELDQKAVAEGWPDALLMDEKNLLAEKIGTLEQIMQALIARQPEIAEYWGR